MNVLRQIFDQRKPWIVVIVILTVLNVLLYVYSSSIQEPRLERMLSVWTEKREIAAGGVEGVAATFTRGAADMKTFESLIPPRKEFTRVVSDIFREAGSNHVAIASVGYQPSKGDGSYETYTLSLSVKGKYAGIKSFLADMQNLREMVVVEGMTLENLASKADEVSLKLQLDVYLRKAGS